MRPSRLHDLGRSGRIEVAGRFVTEQELRIVDERARDGRALLLAAGKFSGIHPALVREPDKVQATRHLTHDVFGVRARYLKCEGDILPHRLVGEEFEILEYHAQMPAEHRHAVAPQPVYPDAVHGDFTTGRKHLAIKQPQETRFSGSGVPDEENEIALTDFEIDTVQGAHSVWIHERNAA